MPCPGRRARTGADGPGKREAGAARWVVLALLIGVPALALRDQAARAIALVGWLVVAALGLPVLVRRRPWRCLACGRAVDQARRT